MADEVTLVTKDIRFVNGAEVKVVSRVYKEHADAERHAKQLRNAIQGLLQLGLCAEESPGMVKVVGPVGMLLESLGLRSVTVALVRATLHGAIEAPVGGGKIILPG